MLCCCQVTTLFSSQNFLFCFFFAEVSMNTLLPFLCLHFFDASPVDSEFALSEECASTCICKSSRLTVNGKNQDKNALRRSLPCSSRLLVHGSPWPACHDLSASVSRMHACHFVLSLDLIMFSIFQRN